MVSFEASSTSESEMERRTKLRPGLCEEGSRRLDETNQFRTFETRNEPVPDVWIIEIETNRNDTKCFFLLIFVDSGRLDNELRNEPVSSGRLDNGNRNELVPDVRMNKTTGSGR
ncbi:hypothetical protein RIR_jg40944.t1 [Rhizophagus irregularis DAOM 181602=DAOM 197198]|nr:hypothetical protein RIR_jg40944.t1 [Rhizophagus irregularis DAOM 181602=DAOM 197198]